MNRIILLVLFVFSYCVGSSQAITQRGTTAVTVQDARLFAQYNFRPPVFNDTTQANLQIGLDSCGALIFSRDINSYYLRACSPKRWVAVSPGGNAWNIGGNTSPSSPNIGTITATEFNTITNGIARTKIKGTGIARSSAARNKYLMIDTTDKYLYYGDAGITIDTTSLSNRINSKLNISDTSSMLSPYSRINVVNASLATKLNISDTASMLSPYSRSINVVKYTDTASMLNNYFNKVNYGLSNTGQTISVDSATLSNKYLRIVDTSNKFVNRITRTAGKDSIIYFVGGTRLAIKDSVGSNPAPVGYYGAWQDNNTQSAALSNVGYPLIYRTVDLENQVRVVSNGTNLTRITFDNTGIYNLQFSVQVQNIDNAQHDVTIWLRKNGTDVTGSAGFISVPARKSAGVGNEGHGVYGWNYLLSVVAGEYYEIVWSTSNAANVTIQYYAAGSPPPSTASVIATVTQQSGIMAGTGITAINSLTGAAQTMVTGTDSTDFKIVSTGTSHTFNLPTASATKRGALSTTDWTTFNGKLGASDTVSLSNRINGKLNISDTSVFQRKSIPSYTILANNTTTTGNATTQNFKDTSGTYSGTITWTGTTAPSGATNHTYRITQVGKCVTINIALVYATNGSAITKLVATLPSGAPTPAQPTGLTSALQNIYVAYSLLASSTNATQNLVHRTSLRNNTGNNGYEFLIDANSATVAQANITCQYWTN